MGNGEGVDPGQSSEATVDEQKIYSIEEDVITEGEDTGRIRNNELAVDMAKRQELFRDQSAKSKIKRAFISPEERDYEETGYGVHDYVEKSPDDAADALAVKNIKKKAKASALEAGLVEEAADMRADNEVKHYLGTQGKEIGE